MQALPAPIASSVGKSRYCKKLRRTRPRGRSIKFPVNHTAPAACLSDGSASHLWPSKVIDDTHSATFSSLSCGWTCGESKSARTPSCPIVGTESRPGGAQWIVSRVCYGAVTSRCLRLPTSSWHHASPQRTRPLRQADSGIHGRSTDALSAARSPSLVAFAWSTFRASRLECSPRKPDHPYFCLK